MKNANLPTVDEARISAIFDSLEKMDVALDPDPIQYGPKRLNQKVAKVRSLLSQCERTFLQVSHDLQIIKSAHRSTQLDFDLQMQDLLANDPEVKAGRNVRDRDALATMKLRDSREEMMDLEVAIQDLEMALTVIKAKRADLRDIQGRLRDQMKLCQEEIGLGARWGSRPAPDTNAPDLDKAPKTDTAALEAMQELLHDTGEVGEVNLEAGDTKWIDEDDEDDESESEATILAELERAAQSEDDDEDDEDDESEAPSLDAVLDEIDETAEPQPEEPSEDLSDLDLDDIDVDIDSVSEDTPASPSEIAPEVESDDEVDAIFNQLETGATKKPPVSEEVDLDSLLDMFGG